MATQTPNYALNKPTVGGDNDVWGDQLNPNFDTIDTEMKSNADTGSGNATDIATNAGAITALDGRVTQNETDIGTNATDIGTNATAITQLGDDKIDKTSSTISADEPTGGVDGDVWYQV